MISTKPLLNALSKAVAILLISLPTAYSAELAGFVAVDQRQFLHNEAFPQQRSGSSPSLILEPEYYHVSQDEKDTYTGRLFWRLDPIDNQRTHLDIRQLDWVHAQNDWELGIGISKVYWGVTESRHLVDVINQVDGVEDIDEESRLGQPMVQLSTFKDWGTMRFLYLPYFRERSFPGRKGRLRPALTVDENSTQYANSAEEFHPDFAARYEHSIDAWDIGLAHFHGTGREPTLRIKGDKLIAFYELIDQTSLDLQYTAGPWLWKLETIGRAGQGDYFGAATGGFEYSFYSIKNSAHDLGILLEYHRDGRDFSAPINSLDNDIFAGFRYTLNDVSDTQFLAGITTDTNDASQFIVFEASHRINTNWKTTFDLRLFTNQNADSPIKAIEQDDFAQARLAYFF